MKGWQFLVFSHCHSIGFLIQSTNLCAPTSLGKLTASQPFIGQSISERKFLHPIDQSGLHLCSKGGVYCHDICLPTDSLCTVCIHVIHHRDSTWVIVKAQFGFQVILEEKMKKRMQPACDMCMIQLVGSRVKITVRYMQKPQRIQTKD